MKDAGKRLAEIVSLAEAGETVTLTRDGKPVVDLVAHKDVVEPAGGEKKGGLNLEAGRKFLRDRGVEQFFTYVAPDFDDPLPEDFLLRPLPE
jgi:antitoxin (DNA-binding transcriptional repressor) of toxin-antitoxin stability system